MTLEFLQCYTQAWNDHDIDAIMQYMAKDCVFLTGGGSGPYGSRFEGVEQVRERFIDVWTSIPDVKFIGDEHFVQGNRGCSQWVFTGTRPDGEKIEVAGLDLFTFKDNKIILKDSYLKNRS